MISMRLSYSAVTSTIKVQNTNKKVEFDQTCISLYDEDARPLPLNSTSRGKYRLHPIQEEALKNFQT